MAESYKNILTKGYLSSLSNLSPEEDKLRFTIDTGQLFLDTNTDRIEISDFIKDLTEDEIRSEFAPLPKFYFAKDSHKLLYYDDTVDEWVAIKGSDTTYSNATTSTDGLMSSADKAKLDGIASGANKYTHPSTHPASMITGLSTVATSGNYNDLSNKPSAATTSVAGLMSSGDKTKLDGIASGANKYTHPSTHPASMITGLSTVATSGNYNDLSNKPSIPSYKNFGGATDTVKGTAGLVPAPATADKDLFLKGDGSWDSPEIVPEAEFIGATADHDGVEGLVPLPMAGDQDKFLKGDGTWAEVVGGGTISESDIFVPSSGGSAGKPGLVPAPNPGDTNLFLRGDGTWDFPEVDFETEFVGAKDGEDGYEGLVPAPVIADKNKFLKGDGTWSNLPTYVGATTSTNGTAGLVPAATTAQKDTALLADGTWFDFDFGDLDA